MSTTDQNIDAQYYDHHENEVPSLNPDADQTVVLSMEVSHLDMVGETCLGLSIDHDPINAFNSEALGEIIFKLTEAEEELKRIVDEEDIYEFLSENYVDMRRRGLVGYVILDPEKEVFSIEKVE